MAITDSLVTVQSVCDYHAKKMNTITDKLGAVRYSTDQLEAIINNVIRFVYANSATTLASNTLLYAINELCKIEFDNRMIDDEILLNLRHVNITTQTLNTLIGMVQKSRTMWVV